MSRACAASHRPSLHGTAYAADHLNYLCLNYTRPTPLPCAAASDKYKPNWFKNGRRRFVIYAWWPPNPPDVAAYAKAGFNVALAENFVGEYCQRKGINATVTHDEIFEVNVRAADALSKLGLLSIFMTGNGCNQQLSRSPTKTYGNVSSKGRVLFEAHVNLTGRAHPGGTISGTTYYGLSIFSKGQSVPELQYITSELRRRGKLSSFAGIQMHDDTVVQNQIEIDGAAWLQQNEPSFVPFVNQVSGTSAPQSLYRSGYFVSAPEQYPIRCPGNYSGHNHSGHSNCTGADVVGMARQQMLANAGNALVDQRFGLDSWPLFHVGDQLPRQGDNVDSDSLLRWMAFSAIAYGATALNYYCWGGGLWLWDANMSLPGRPGPMYQTATEINADAAEWGDEMLGGGFGFASALHTGFTNPQDGGGPPSSETIVTAMSADLLVGVFVPSELRGGGKAEERGGRTEWREADAEAAEEQGPYDTYDTYDPATPAAPAAYLFVVDKRVSGQLAPVAARNVTLTLHPSVGSASVARPGRQGARGFEEVAARHGVRSPPPPTGARRSMYASVRPGAASSDGGAPLLVTVELLGGGAALVRLYAAPAKPAGTPPPRPTARAPQQISVAAIVDAAFAGVTWMYEPGLASLQQIKAPQWAYDSWHSRYRPYEGLELTDGRSFEEGEQTAFLIGGSFAGTRPPTAADEAQAWAWAGFNLLSLSAPAMADLAAYGPASKAIGAVLDYGYAFGFFAAVEPAEEAAVMRPSEALAVNRAFRCHGRWLGLMVARNASGSGRSLDAPIAAAAALRRTGRWLLPLASALDAPSAIELGQRGIAFAMPSVPPFAGLDAATRTAKAAEETDAEEEAGNEGGAARASEVTTARARNISAAEAWAQSVAQRYDPMRRLLAASFVPRPTSPGQWLLSAPMAFSASLDACAAESDSMLRWSAFSALAYGARGVFWRGAGACAPFGSPKFALLASINKRLVQWGNTFVASSAPSDFPGGGYNVTRLYATGYSLAGAVAPGSGGGYDLVQAADADVLIAQLGSMGRAATPLIYVVDKRVSPLPGAAAVRTVRVTLHARVAAWQPIEGDCAAAHCQCGLSVVGNTVEVSLPGGSGQLVALVGA